MGARSPPPCFLTRVLRGRPRSLRFASVPVCYPPYAHWPHSYPLLRRAASAFVFVHVSDPRSRFSPWPLPPRCLVIPSLLTRSPQHPSFIPWFHMGGTFSGTQVLDCVGANRRCLHWLRRVRSVLTYLLLLFHLLRRVISFHRVFTVSQVSLLSCTMLICAHTLFLTHL